jgi:hypothetical protein
LLQHPEIGERAVVRLIARRRALRRVQLEIVVRRQITEPLLIILIGEALSEGLGITIGVPAVEHPSRVAATVDRINALIEREVVPRPRLKRALRPLVALRTIDPKRIGIKPRPLPVLRCQGTERRKGPAVGREVGTGLAELALRALLALRRDSRAPRPPRY